MSKKTSRCGGKTTKTTRKSSKRRRAKARAPRPNKLFPLTFYQVLIISAVEGEDGYQPERRLCGHHHAELGDALICRKTLMPEPHATHKLIVGHALFGFGVENRELWWLDEATSEFAQVVDAEGWPSALPELVPMPADFQDIAAKVYEPITVEPDPVIRRLLREVA